MKSNTVNEEKPVVQINEHGTATHTVWKAEARGMSIEAVRSILGGFDREDGLDDHIKELISLKHKDIVEEMTNLYRRCEQESAFILIKHSIEVMKESYTEIEKEISDELERSKKRDTAIGIMIEKHICGLDNRLQQVMCDIFTVCNRMQETEAAVGSYIMLGRIKTDRNEQIQNLTKLT